MQGLIPALLVGLLLMSTIIAYRLGRIIDLLLESSSKLNAIVATRENERAAD